MATIFYPAALDHKKPLLNSTTKTFSSNKQEVLTQTDFLARKTTAKVAGTLAVAFHFTRAELDIFETFYKETLQEGTLPFRYTDPYTQRAIDVQIQGAPSLSPLGPQDFSVSLNLIIRRENI